MLIVPHDPGVDVRRPRSNVPCSAAPVDVTSSNGGLHL
jgi:hypothetical protein